MRRDGGRKRRGDIKGGYEKEALVFVQAMKTLPGPSRALSVLGVWNSVGNYFKRHVWG